VYSIRLGSGIRAARKSRDDDAIKKVFVADFTECVDLAVRFIIGSFAASIDH
jgi:hypothetical protein